MQKHISFKTFLGVTSFIILAVLPMQSWAQGKNKNKNKSKDQEIVLATPVDSFSYMIGIAIGHSLKSQKVEGITISLIARGMEEVMKNDSAISMQDANTFLNNFFTDLREKTGATNLIKGKQFLEENKKAPGVTETASGLQIKTIQEGTGKSPKATDKVRCHYAGRLLNGDIFDSSYDRGEPAEFELQGVISGWTEGLQLMKEGGKYELFIPSELAYGSRGAGQSIGPNETLIFEIELLQVLDSDEEIPMEEDEQGNY
jgi:FKBP-type peptidyl-prolyl cis-trans isomerase FklB